MPAGSSPKREREYEELKERFKEEGRYPGREEEVAARIVNKQRAEFGETREARAEDRRGESPDSDLPIKNYDQKTVQQIEGRLDDLSPEELEEIEEYEREHRSRKTLSDAIDRAQGG